MLALGNHLLDFSFSSPHALVCSSWPILQAWPKNSWLEPQSAHDPDSRDDRLHPKGAFLPRHHRTTSSPETGQGMDGRLQRRGVDVHKTNPRPCGSGPRAVSPPISRRALSPHLPSTSQPAERGERGPQDRVPNVRSVEKSEAHGAAEALAHARDSVQTVGGGPEDKLRKGRRPWAQDGLLYETFL